MHRRYNNTHTSDMRRMKLVLKCYLYRLLVTIQLSVTGNDTSVSYRERYKCQLQVTMQMSIIVNDTSVSYRLPTFRLLCY